MRICIISGRYPETTFKSAINHKIYAEKYGYSYIHCNYPTKAENSYLNKIHYLLNYIDLYDYIVWIDDDAFFINFEQDIMQFAPKGDMFLSACKSPTFKPLKTYFSSGQFILKSNALSKQFLNDIINANFSTVKSWWTDDLGYFSNGDQDAMVYLLLTKEIYKNTHRLYNYKAFNSRIENILNEDDPLPLILHFTGKPIVKKKNYLKAQRFLGLPASLVSKKYLQEYKVSKKDKTVPSLKNYLKKIINWFYS